jgi:hypothetical protein
VAFDFDKILLLTDQSIRKAVFACQGILCIEKRGLAMRLGKGDGAACPFEESVCLLVESPFKKAF